MLVQRVAFLLAVAHAAARPAGPKARALPRQQAAQRRKGWTAKLKFLRDDWQEAVLRPRGGASSLTTLTHAALGAVFEAGALLGVVKAARALPPGASSAIARLKILPSDTIKGLPAAEWFAWCVIIFGSSAVGAVVDGSLRAATNQILSGQMPNLSQSSQSNVGQLPGGPAPGQPGGPGTQPTTAPRRR